MKCKSGRTVALDAFAERFCDGINKLYRGEGFCMFSPTQNPPRYFDYARQCEPEFNFVVGQLFDLLRMMPMTFPHKSRRERTEPDSDFNRFVAREDAETALQTLVSRKIFWAGEFSVEHAQRLHPSKNEAAHFFT